jgi:hypothetical protein
MSVEVSTEPRSTQRTRVAVLVLTVIVAVPAFLLNSIVWLPAGPPPTAAQMPYLLALDVMQAVFLGLGVSFVLSRHQRALYSGQVAISRRSYQSPYLLLLFGQQAELYRPHHRLCAVGDPEFLDDASHIGLDRRQAHQHLLCYLPVRLA